MTQIYVSITDTTVQLFNNKIC